ncbi:MAG: site-specific integrase [Oceanospirillales bacterium]|nr:site-specific integrase [Oceanospirillales bacterium]MBR9886437.1 site-specific integrase [Oceanospirillales bacterium]
MQYSYNELDIDTSTHKGKYVGIFDDHNIPEIPTSAFLVFLRDYKGVSLSTLHSYASTLVHFLNTVYASPSVRSWDRITPTQVKHYLENDRAVNLKSSSIEGCISRLKQFFEWANENGWLEESLKLSWILSHEKMAELKQYQAQQASTDPLSLFSQYISPSEFKFFLRFNPRKRSFERARDEIVLSLAYLSGFRSAETVNPDNINLKRIKKAIEDANDQGLKGFYLSIIGKGLNGGKVRNVYIPPELKNKILAFIRGPLKRKCPKADLLICKMVKGQSLPLETHHATSLFGETLNKLLSEGEIEETSAWRAHAKYRRFHSLRHSYATNFAMEIRLGKGFEKTLQERMGHAHITTTHIYLHFEAVLAGDHQAANKFGFNPDAGTCLESTQELINDQD